MLLKINKTFWVLTLSHLFFYSCKERKQSTKNDVNPSLSSEFLDFYEHYGKDSIFQIEHTVFPLEGIKAPGNETDVIDSNFRWTQDSWIFQKEFDDMDGAFTREFYDLNGVIVEKIADKTGNFTMERRFGKLSSGWHLIYYRELGMYGK